MNESRWLIASSYTSGNLASVRSGAVGGPLLAVEARPSCPYDTPDGWEMYHSPDWAPDAATPVAAPIASPIVSPIAAPTSAAPSTASPTSDNGTAFGAPGRRLVHGSTNETPPHTEAHDAADTRRVLSHTVSSPGEVWSSINEITVPLIECRPKTNPPLRGSWCEP